MLIKHIELPEELITAQKEGRLVIFAGAGVSMEPPANFPSFKKLAEEIAQRVGVKLEEPLDRFLGKLKRQGTDVHQIVKEILFDPESKPTSLHFNLLKLFPSPKEVRIVTTNFDKHFSTASAKIFGDKVPIYRAPALPLGHNFNGIVYLHGCVDQEPDNLILTDEDFGRAYLTEGWATNFLKDMFRSYVVLFIGYSHNDLIMQYLSRGLPPGTSRYALTEKGKEEHWEYFGITPIPYPLKDGEHKALDESIDTWVKRSKMGFLDHEQRIKSIVESPPSLNPEENDYIEHILKEPPTARFFIRYARDPEWLRWVEERGFFDPLFQGGEVDEINRLIANWFAENFVLQHPEEALSLIQRKGQCLNPTLWQAIVQHLSFSRSDLAQEVLTKWVMVLIFTKPTSEGQLLEELLRKCVESGNNKAALLLFVFLTKPVLRLKSYLLSDDKNVDFEVITQGDEHRLIRIWERWFKPNLEVYIDKLEIILTNQIRSAYSLLSALGKANKNWDPVSYGRPAIEPHEQNHYLNPLNILIDAARDVLEYLLAHNLRHAQDVIETWASSDVPILKRLAVHGITKNEQLTPDEKIKWLLKKGWLYAPGMKHEVFCLLKTAYPHASESVKVQLLREAEKGETLKAMRKLKEETLSYEIYNLLYWLTQIAPDCKLAKERFEIFQHEHPDFAPREYPDFDGLIIEGRTIPQSPITADELLTKSPREIAEWLLTYQGDRFWEPNREGLLEELKIAIAKSFEWGWELVTSLREREEWDTDIWRVIFRAWQEIPMDEVQWQRVIEFLKVQSELYPLNRNEIADFLLHGIKRGEGRIPLTLLPDAEKVAESLWNLLEIDREEIVDTDDWLIKAINHPGGKVTEFYLHALSEQRTEFIPEDCKQKLNKVISGKSYASQMGKIILTSQLNFLFYLDPDWTKANIIPLLNWSIDERQAQQAWHGYAIWGRWNDRLLEDLMPLYRQTFSRLPRELKHLREQICDHLANIAIYSSINPLEDGWLKEFLTQVEEEDRENWASSILYHLYSLSNEAKIELWKSWLQEYWSQRAMGIPVQLTPGELRRMIKWALEMEPVFPSVVEQICKTRPPDLEQTFYYELAEKELVEKYPKAVARLLVHLLPEAQAPFYYCKEIEGVFERLRDSGAPRRYLLLICEHLARLGCPRAGELRQLL